MSEKNKFIKTYSCEICNKQYSNSNSLNTHNKKYHFDNQEDTNNNNRITTIDNYYNIDIIIKLTLDQFRQFFSSDKEKSNEIICKLAKLTQKKLKKIDLSTITPTHTFTSYTVKSKNDF
jgi:hypothetical protein